MSDSKKDEIKIDGKKEAAELLALLDESSRERILLGISEQNPELAKVLRKGLFSFKQVLNLESVELQMVMKNFPMRLFALVLRGLEPDLLRAFFSKLSERQGRAFQEEIAAIGPSKVSDVKIAQEKIIEKARELHENGQIKLC